MSKGVLIGLAGEDRSGKGTVASWLMKEHDFTCCSFAAAMKVAVGEALHLEHDFLYGDRRDEKLPEYGGRTTRDFLLAIGGGARQVDPDIWVAILAPKVLKILETTFGGGVVIDDVRYRNEAEWIRSVGGVIWRCKRVPDANARRYGLDEIPPEWINATLKAESGQVDKLRSMAAEAWIALKQ